MKDVRLVDISKLDEDSRQYLVEYMNELANELGVRDSDIIVYECDVVPIRIQHLINELGKKGQVVLETLVLNGKFFLLTLKRSNRDLKLAVDYEFRG